MNGFRGTLGITVIQCRPRDPEAKGLVERANGYLETSFLPGRRFAGPADFNAQLQRLADAGERPPASGAGMPAGRPVGRRPGRDAGRCRQSAPVTGWRVSTRLPRDHYVRVDSNDYSVHPSVIGRTVEIAAGLRGGNGHLRRAARSPGTSGAGPLTRASPTPPIAAAAAQLRQARRLVTARPADTHVAAAGAVATTTGCSAPPTQGAA